MRRAFLALLLGLTALVSQMLLMQWLGLRAGWRDTFGPPVTFLTTNHNPRACLHRSPRPAATYRYCTKAAMCHG